MVEALLLLFHGHLVADALVELLSRFALLDLFGGLWRDVHGADGLAVGVEGRARVFPFISGAD